MCGLGDNKRPHVSIERCVEFQEVRRCPANVCRTNTFQMEFIFNRPALITRAKSDKELVSNKVKGKKEKKGKVDFD